MRRPDTGAPAATLSDLIFRGADEGTEFPPAATHALRLAADALSQVELDASLIHEKHREEAWQAGIGHLYQATINLFAARCLLDPDVSDTNRTGAVALHEVLMQHLRARADTAAPKQIERLVSGDLRHIPPMGRLILFAALLREAVLARKALAVPAAGLADEAMARMDAMLRRLGDRLVALAYPMLPPPPD